MLLRLSLCVLSLLTLASCDLFEKERSEEPADALARYQAAFLEEAAARGFDFKDELNNLQFRFEDRLLFDGEEFCGYVPVATSGAYTNEVLFATNENCWTGRPEAAQEALVFHELGHAILDRFHRNDKFPNGAWVSIMATKSASTFYVGNIADRRKYYLDELFDPSTPPPDWGQ